MKRFLLSVLLFPGCLFASAQPVQVLENGMYGIQSGDVTMTVDAAHGGKILSFQYKDREILSQAQWPNAFGSTFWTSPQAVWNWPPIPEHDSAPYTVDRADDVLVLTGPVSEKYGFRIRKRFSADPADGAVVITYSILNESGESRQVAPWEITRVPNGGVVGFRARVEDIWPAGLVKASQFADDLVRIDIDVADVNRKVNADGEGWLAFSDGALVFLKTFPDITPSQAAPEGAEIQVYVNAGKAYVEIENQGACQTLSPGGFLNYTVRWYALPLDKTLPDTVAPLIR